MKFSTLLRLAFSGSLTDRVRAGLTVMAAVLAGLAILATGTVLNMAPTEQTFTVPGGFTMVATSWRYTTTLLNETGLRPGLIAMVAATLIPALVLIAQSARLGGPARDHRLAAMRLAGATPRQSRSIAAAEQGVTVGLGALLAMAVYPLLHALLHRPTMAGARQVEGFDLGVGVVIKPYAGPLLPLPTDTWPAWWSWLVVALGLPVLAALLSAVALRRVIASPWVAARRVRRTRPRLWPIWLTATGLTDLAVCRIWIDRLQTADPSAPEPNLAAPYLTMVAGLAAICVGVPLCAAAVGHLGARLALRYGRRPGTLIAARRVLADPYAGSRAVSVLLACTVLAVALVGIRTRLDFTGEVMAKRGMSYADPELNGLVLTILDTLTQVFVLFAVVGLLIALVESAMTRRRTEAALLASGTPKAMLIRSRVTMVLLTAVPGVLLGLAVGFAAPSLAMDQIREPASITPICHSRGDNPTVVACTAEGLARQQQADANARAGKGEPAYSQVEYDVAGPWHTVRPPIPWIRLAGVGGLALAVVAAATVLSLLVGRRSSAITALRTT
jgi:hypothetical protein